METTQSHERKSNEKLQPREYQESLAVRALDKNVIAFLNTGAGKTLISTLVIERFAEELYRKGEERKWSIFLVPTIPLVFQQSAYIERITGLKVGKYCGDNTEAWSKQDWQQQFEEYQVLVMVHQIFLELLRHAFFSISKCNLIIFDECHHTTKNHPYNRIMREFYQSDPMLPPFVQEDPFQRRQGRPRILGLTASPIINSNEDTNKCQQLLQDLETQLDSKIIIANQQEVNLFVKLPLEKICDYDPPSEEPLLAKISSFEILQELERNEEHYKLCTALQYIASQLGLWCCNRLIQKMLKELESKIPKINDNTINNPANFSNLTNKFRFLQQLQYELDSRMLNNPSQMIHPKVKVLLSLLSRYWQMNDNNNHEQRAILFVERKSTAFCLLDLLETVKQNGHQKESAQSVDALLHQQVNTPLQRLPILPLQQPRPPSPQGVDGKSRLLIYCQKRNLGGPVFEYQQRGPPHCPEFWCSVTLGQYHYDGSPNKTFKNQKDAEKYACEKLLEIIDQQPDDKKQKVTHHERVFNSLQEYSIPIHVGSIKADVLIGHGTNDDWKFMTMDVEAQQSKVEAFRKGEVNMLISTSVGEEGLDIQPCNLVIQFDELKTVKSYIQSRGRARHPKAHFVCMVESSPQSKGLELIENARNCEHTMRQIIASYADKEPDSEDEENDSFLDEEYFVTKIGAKLTVQSSKSLLNQYCQKLPSDVYCKLLPRYEEHCMGEEYQYDLVLPNNCPVQQKKISGPPHKSKIHAKKLTAFYACKILYQEKELDENLLPVKIKPFEDAQLSEETQPRPLECEVMVPAEFQPKTNLSMEFYQNLLNLSGNGVKATYCLLTHTRLPALPPFQLSNNIHVNMIPSSNPLLFSPQHLLKCIKFHQLLWDGLMQKNQEELIQSQEQCSLENSGERFFLIVPGNHQGIHWSQLDWCLSNMQFPRPSQLSPDLILLTPYSQEKVLYCFQQQSQFNPQSAFPNPKYESFANYFLLKHQCQISNMLQPLLQVHRLSRPKNLLSSQTSSSSEQHTSTSQLVPELCVVHPLPQSLLVPALNLPSILYRIETFLIANDLKQYLPPIKDLELVRQAITSKKTQEQANYERLETLGDSFLKFAMSLQLYALHPHQHEGFLSETRSKFTSNNYLCKLGLKQHIPEHIINKIFELDWWTWPNFSKMDSNMELLRYHDIKRKTIADCVEAILGAFYLSEGEQATWNLMQEWFPAFFENLQHPPLPPNLTNHQQVIVTEAQKSLAYQFKNPYLLLQALTHASMSHSKRPEEYSVPCYQRLEFLGDAILDIIITNYLFEKYPALEPGELTNLRASAVNSNAFSYIAISHKLHQFTQRISPSLDQHIERYVSSVRDNNGMYSEEHDAPKVLGDVLEAVTAAVFIDVGYKLDAVWNIMQRILLPFLEQNVLPGQTRNPVAEVMEWVSKQKCKHEWKTILPTEEGERQISVKLRIYKEGSKDLNENGVQKDVQTVVGKASNKKVAKRRAAIEALEKIKYHKNDMEI